MHLISMADQMMLSQLIWKIGPWRSPNQKIMGSKKKNPQFSGATKYIPQV